MRLSISREQLLTPLQWVNGVVQRKQTMPVLSHVLLDANNNVLTVTGTDTEVELKGILPVESGVHKPGQIKVPARKLLDICRSLPDNAIVELQGEQDCVYVRSGNTRFSLATLPETEFPTIESEGEAITLNILQDQLKKIIQRTYFAMAEDDVRHYLNGLLIEIEDKVLRAVATDGHRLAYNQTELDQAVSAPIRVIVPNKAVMELAKILKDEAHPITMEVTNQHIRVQADEFIFTSCLVDSRYPDYHRVIPQKDDVKLTLDRVPFKQALSRAAILCNERLRTVALQIKNKMMRIHAKNASQEEAEEVINLNYDGPDIELGFNVNYLLDVMNTIETDSFDLWITKNRNSILIEEPENTNSLFVVMAMQV